jgi:histidine triad (HIT) family protein
MSCLFCRIVAREVPATIVHEGERTLAFRDVNPQAPTHVLVIPTLHVANAAELAEADPSYVGEVLATAAQVARDEGLGTGYRLVTNTGPDAGQSVDHLHFHLLGGRSLGWPPG